MKTHLLSTTSVFIAFSLIALSFLSSCDQDGQEVSPSKESSCRLIKTYLSGDIHGQADSTGYHYDNQDRLIKRIEFYKEIEKHITTYEFNSQGQISKQIINDKALDNQQQYTIDIVDVLTYEYNSKGLITKLSMIRTTPQKGDYNYREPSETVFEYDPEDNRTKITRIVNTTSNPVSFISEFTYQGGNCVKSVINPGRSTEMVKEYEYDLSHEDKLKSFNESYNLVENTPNKNMLKKIIIKSQQDPNTTTREYTYEYDNNGNAIKNVITTTSTAYSSKFTAINSKKYACR